MESRVYPARLEQTPWRQRVSSVSTTPPPTGSSRDSKPLTSHTLVLFAGTPQMSSWRLESILLREEVMVKLQLRIWMRFVSSCAFAAVFCSDFFACTAATNLVRLQGNSFRDDAGPPCPIVFPETAGLAGPHRLHDLPHDPNGEAKKPNTDSKAAEDSHGAAQPITDHASMAPIASAASSRILHLQSEV